MFCFFLFVQPLFLFISLSLSVSTRQSRTARRKCGNCALGYDLAPVRSKHPKHNGCRMARERIGSKYIVLAGTFSFSKPWTRSSNPYRRSCKACLPWYSVNGRARASRSQCAGQTFLIWQNNSCRQQPTAYRTHATQDWTVTTWRNVQVFAASATYFGQTLYYCVR